MSDHELWEVIVDADSSHLILGVGLPVTRQREAGLAEFATKIGSKYRFLLAKVPNSCPSQRVRGNSYVSNWIGGIRNRPVAAVLGHRVGCVYAAAIAENLTRWQPIPRVILFDPQLASSGLLSHELHSEFNSISSLLSGDEIERAEKLGAEIAESDDVASAAATAAEIYWEISSAAFERVGLGGDYCSKSFASFESYMSLIAAAAQMDPGLVWRCSTALLSSDYPDLPGRPFLTDKSSIPFDISHIDLLRSDSVAETVLDLLELR
jgi:hypothetical protein